MLHADGAANTSRHEQQEAAMAVATKIKQLVVITPNEVGTLEKLCAAVRDAGGGITHICASTIGDDARFMLGVSRMSQVRAALEALEYEVSETEAVTVELNNVTGALEPVAQRLSAAKVDIDFLYGTSSDGARATCVVSTNDNDRALEVISWVPEEAEPAEVA
jgi:hypothetical protein